MVKPSLLRRGAAALVTCVVLATSLASSALAQPVAPPNQGPITLTADHIEYDTQTGNVVADGHVVATRGGTTITAEHLTGNLKTGDVQAAGRVVLTEPGRTTTGQNLRYNYRTRVGEMSQAVTKAPPWTLTGRRIATAAGQGTATAATATPCDPAHPAFRVTAKKVVIVPDDYLRAYDAVLRVYGVPVFYVPVYTASLKRNRKTVSSGPTVGYDNFNGIWVEYNQYVPLGSWESQVRVRYGTRSGVSGEAVIQRQFSGYTLAGHLGRAVSFDQNGNQFNFDQYTAEVDIGGRIGGLPLSYAFDAQAGQFLESQSGVNAFRTEGLLTLTSDTIHLTPSLTASSGGYYRYDTYSVGDVRNIAAAAMALTQVLGRISSTTLSYNFAQVTGATPFLFDAISSDSAVSLSYSYYPGGWFQSGTISDTYDFLTQQTTAGLNLAFTISPSLQFGTNVSYNLTTQQLSEVDYAVSATCDCVALGVVYRTFPPNPVSNQWYITLGINTLPGIATSFTVGPR